MTRELETVTASLRAAATDAGETARVLHEHTKLITPWLVRAERDLRLALARRDVDKAKDLGVLILKVRQMRASNAEERGAARLHTEAVGCLLTAIEAVHIGDTPGALPLLSAICSNEHYDTSLRWAAQLWRARSLAELGQTEETEDALRSAARLAGDLDERAQFVTECKMVECEVAHGETALSLDRITFAVEAFERLDDAGGMALARLAEARALRASGMDTESSHAAKAAISLDPSWADPAIFLAERALERGELDQADALLDEAPATSEVTLRRDLLQRARAGTLPLASIVEYLQLRQQLPSDESQDRLQKLVATHSDFSRARELLAWRLIQSGHHGDALPHLSELARHPLDETARTSVVLGLASVDAVEPCDDDQIGELMGALNRWLIRTQLELADRHAKQRLEPKPTTTPSLAAIKAIISAVGSPAGSSPAMTGSLATLQVPQLLEFFRSTQRTGALLLNAEEGSAVVVLRGGMVLGAAAPGCEDPIDLLLKEGALTEAQVQEARARQQSSPELTTALAILQLGYLDHEALHAAADRQIRQAISTTMAWSNGRFAFRPEITWIMELPDHPPVDPQRLLLDIAMGELDDETG